jgi:hypothetical protein
VVGGRCGGSGFDWALGAGSRLSAEQLRRFEERLADIFEEFRRAREKILR